MICSVLKRKESIKSVTPAKGLTIISKLRTSLHENMEKLLIVWVTEKQLQGDTLTQTIICEKARAIYGYAKHLFRRCFEVTESTNLTLREFWKDHFNIAICLQIIDQAWLGVTTRTLTSAWKKLWPEAVAERIYEELEPGVSVKEEIVSLGKSMGLEVEERDVNELIEEHTQELTTEEIQELQSQQHTEVMQVIGFEESEEEVISTSEIREILGIAIISEVVRDRGYMDSLFPGLTSQRADQDSEVQSDTDDGKSLEPLRSLDSEAMREEGPVLRRNTPRARRPPVRFRLRLHSSPANLACPSVCFKYSGAIISKEHREDSQSGNTPFDPEREIAGQKVFR
ncbi:hypothetical protein LAZ67_23000637 [Cordylochernes scorpioides]|uniref:DDE-1 domain-containing protein n=1 Tax=Cordylochernes scorpioides TaxID=51811 RepID=A0ABY6LSN3_9ARAC|nr:hypothetical protein LAZ67_23000637 [Cordylochernes scorpioides]